MTIKTLTGYFILFLVLASCAASKRTTGMNYEVVSDSETKVLRGIISRQVIENDTAFAWFKNNMQLGMVDEEAAAIFKEKASSGISLMIFGGTWCHDSQNLLPKFYRMIDKSGFPEKNITLVVVDRNKTAPDNLHVKYNITNVPTFIVLKNGKETGRVVEYGKTGNIEKELADIVQGS
ncbi:thioredoxin family protein [Sediminibacterium ginsengisoli]|nr:thioredoxin family protein [Sediminibacterium ginsengisoli]